MGKKVGERIEWSTNRDLKLFSHHSLGCSLTLGLGTESPEYALQYVATFLAGNTAFGVGP